MPLIAHLDFTGDDVDPDAALTARFSDGMHVAEIIAEIIAGTMPGEGGRVGADSRVRDGKGGVTRPSWGSLQHMIFE